MSKKDIRTLKAMGKDFVLPSNIVEELIGDSQTYEQARRRMIKIVFDKL